MEEKKLTDEEIVKALEICAVEVDIHDKDDCKECPYFMKKIDCVTGKRSEKDTLNLIHRLQDEIETLKSTKFANWRLKFFKAQEEIERLTEELKNCGQELIDSHREQEELQDQNAELQRKSLLKCDCCPARRDLGLLLYQNEQAVKDRTREIFEWLEKHCFFNGFEIVETYFKERYGLEVE